MKKTGKAFLCGGVLALSLALTTQGFAAAAPDPTTAGSYTAKFIDYKGAASIDPLVTSFNKTEIWARVWYPANKSSKSPLVILLHGNHFTCGHQVGQFRIDDRNDYATTGTCPAGYVVTPNHTGYDYVASRLATRGYFVVSINVNRGINGLGDDARENDPSMIQRRGRMILRHMQLLYGWNKNGGPSTGFNLKGKLDFTKVTLFGHSRGGDAIVAAYNIYKTSSAWRSRVPGVKFVAVAPLAPTDAQNGAPNIVGAPLSVLLPMCDGDVNRLSGIGFYDRSVLANTPDTAGNFKSVLATWGANHNGYNTQWQVDDNNPSDHTCPNQNRLFQPGPGLVPSQQTIGRYFLMAVALGGSETVTYARLFNPAYTLPAALKSVTRFDRSFFAGRGPVSLRLVRFDGTCSAKAAVTSGVIGSCLNLPEHNSPTTGARIRWGSPASVPETANYAVFTVNNGAAVNMNQFNTLDMRVAPDCHRFSSGSTFACDGPTLQGNGLGGAQGVYVLLQDASGHFSKPVYLASYVDRREAVGVSTTNLPVNPLYHALYSSARIPVSAFPTSGFAITSVRKIWIYLGDQNSKGGLFFGDIYGVSVPNTTMQDVSADETSVVSAGDGPVIAAAAEANVPLPPRNIVLIPASDNDSAADSAQAQAAPAIVVAADPGNRILSAARSTLVVGTGEPAPDGNPELAPTRTVPAIEFLVSTEKQIVEGGAGMSVRIGSRLVQTRRFSTGREIDWPSVIKLVVPAEAVNAEPDGASLAVVSGGSVFQFGPLHKSAIR